MSNIHRIVTKPTYAENQTDRVQFVSNGFFLIIFVFLSDNIKVVFSRPMFFRRFGQRDTRVLRRGSLGGIGNATRVRGESVVRAAGQ